MDTSDAIRILIGAVLIAIGIPLFQLARYLLAPEETKKRIAQGLKVIGVAWVVVGLILYLVVLLTNV
jgi:hypothetical protein